LWYTEAKNAVCLCLGGRLHPAAKAEKGGIMEPAGRYAWQNFKHFVKPQLTSCRAAFSLLWRAMWGLVGAIFLGLAFAVAALRRKE